MAYPRFGRARSLVKARRTAGDLTLNSTSWANVDTGLDLTLDECQEGDEIVYGVSGLLGATALEVKFDAVTVVSGTPTNSFAKRGAVDASPGAHIAAWYVNDTAKLQHVGGTTPPYTVVAGDLVSGAITFRLRYATYTATNRTLLASASHPLDVWVMNLGPAQG